MIHMVFSTVLYSRAQADSRTTVRLRKICRGQVESLQHLSWNMQWWGHAATQGNQSGVKSVLVHCTPGQS